MASQPKLVFILFGVAVLAVLAVLAVFVEALNTWPGAWWTYAIFTVTFTGLLIVGIWKRVSLGFVFLTCTLWIGFWLKLSMHTIEKSLAWVEPTGLFDFSSPSSWDKVALLSSLGALAVICAGVTWKGRIEDKLCANLQAALPKIRFLAWFIALFILALTILINEYFGIFHAGITAPILDVPWPLQGVFNWFLGATLLIVLIPFYLEAITGKSLFLPLFVVLVAAGVLSISIGSRATTAFLSAWIVLAFIAYRHKMRWINWRRILLITILCFIAILTVALLSQMRREGWQQIASEQIASEQVASEQVASEQVASEQVASEQNSIRQSGQIEARFVFSSYTIWHMAHLPIDRWIGLEGIMAVSAYPNKGEELMMLAISEKGVKGKPDMYTSKISGSGFSDATKTAYVTLPGMFAYWYYSDSPLILFIAVYLLVVIAIGTERVVMRVTQNPFLSTAIGISSAITINMSPGGLFIPAMMLALNLVLVISLGLATNRIIGKASLMK